MFKIWFLKSIKGNDIASIGEARTAMLKIVTIYTKIRLKGLANIFYVILFE